MATKKFVITGLGPAATVESLEVWLGGFGPVVSVKIIRDGNPAAPIAFVEMAVGNVQAFRLTRIRDYWHDGDIVSAWLMHY